MLKQTKIIKVFEWLWLTAAMIAVGLAAYKTFVTGEDAVYGYYLFIAAICLFMFFFKRKSRKWLEKRAAAHE